MGSVSAVQANLVKNVVCLILNRQPAILVHPIFPLGGEPDQQQFVDDGFHRETLWDQDQAGRIGVDNVSAK